MADEKEFQGPPPGLSLPGPSALEANLRFGLSTQQVVDQLGSGRPFPEFDAHGRVIRAYDWLQLPNFQPHEVACRCGCGMLPKFEFMLWIQRMRTALGFPFNPTSGARCETYDNEIDGAGCHPTGLAIDLSASGIQARRIVAEALLAPEAYITGIGLRQHGPWKERFIHLDAIPITDPTHPRPALWTYDQKGRRQPLPVITLTPKVTELSRMLVDARRSLNEGASNMARERLRLVHEALQGLIIEIDRLGFGGGA